MNEPLNTCETCHTTFIKIVFNARMIYYTCKSSIFRYGTSAKQTSPSERGNKSRLRKYCEAIRCHAFPRYRLWDFACDDVPRAVVLAWVYTSRAAAVYYYMPVDRPCTVGQARFSILLCLVLGMLAGMPATNSHNVSYRRITYIYIYRI